MAKLRADELLIGSGLVESEVEARGLIMAGRVLVTDRAGRERRVDKPSEQVDDSCQLRIKGDRPKFASRAGSKLEGPLDALNIEVEGRVCADIGASTGGFTDCLLSRGALRVHAVDVAYGIIDYALRNDPRVVLYERTNARHLEAQAFGELVDLMVIDVSFISLSSLWPALIAQLKPGGTVLAMVKPQFELPKERVPQGGVVSDEADRQWAVEQVVESARAHGLEKRGSVDSPLPGAKGNLEHFVAFTKGA